MKDFNLNYYIHRYNLINKKKMPPKPAPGKKGKDDAEDYSDVATLPPLNSVLASVLPRYFFSA